MGAVMSAIKVRRENLGGAARIAALITTRAATFIANEFSLEGRHGLLDRR
jgi:hypothetical protein